MEEDLLGPVLGRAGYASDDSSRKKIDSGTRYEGPPMCVQSRVERSPI